MKAIKLILKAILFYTTLVTIIIVACGIGDVYTQDYTLYAIILIALLVYSCKKTINKEDIDIISLNKLFEKIGM